MLKYAEAVNQVRGERTALLGLLLTAARFVCFPRTGCRSCSVRVLVLTTLETTTVWP